MIILFRTHIKDQINRYHSYALDGAGYTSRKFYLDGHITTKLELKVGGGGAESEYVRKAIQEEIYFPLYYLWRPTGKIIYDGKIDKVGKIDKLYPLRKKHHNT